MMNVGTLVSAAIRPNNSLDPIASAFASEIKGGLHTASSSTDRNNIISERRDWGMMCYVVNQDTTYQLKYGYVDTNIMNNANWVEFTGGGSGGGEWIDSVLSVSFEPPATYSVGNRYLAGTNPNQTLTGAWSTYSAGVVFEWNSINWIPTYPTDGMSVRVDNEDNSIYRYEGVYPSGEWAKENLSQIRAIDINTINGVLFDANTEPKFDGYVRDMMFLSTFNSSNTGTTASININSLGEVIIKKPTSTGLVDFTPGEIVPGLVYSLVYDGVYFQLIKHYSDGSGGLSIKYYIEPNDYITVPPYHQYWVYGDLTIDGTLVNYGEVVIGNGSIVMGSGTFSNYGSLKLVTLAQGYLSGSSSIYFNDTDTIEIVEQTTITGLSVSANVRPNSLLPINLNTSTYSGPTAGYVLSSTNDGYFEWVQQSAKLTVIDGTPGQGITVSDVNNMVFIGGTVKVPLIGGTDSAVGVQVLPGGQSYPTGTALIYIPKSPEPIYASYYNNNTQPLTNTNGLVIRSLSISNVRISSPTSTNNPFSIGNWSILPDSVVFAATIENSPSFITVQEVTGFSGTASGSNSTITIEFLDGDGITVLHSYTTPVISANGTFTDINGSDTLVTVTITNYGIDDSGFPEIYPPKWKAIPQVVVNARNIFNLVGRQGGRYQIKITHNLDGPTNYYNDSNPTYTSPAVFLDFNPNTPSINGSTTIQETSPSSITTRFISGVQYYTTGSEFTIGVNDILNFNRNTQGFNGGIDYNFRLKSTGFGLPGGGINGSSATNGNLNLRAWAPLNGTFSGWSNQFDLGTVSYSRTDWSINSTTYRYRGTGARMESQVYDPWGVSTVSLSFTQNILVDCNQTISNDLVENFNVENKRLVRGLSNYTTWDSQSLLSTTSTATNGTLGGPTTPYVDALFVGGELRSPVRYFLTDPNNQIQTNLSGFKPDKNLSNPNYSALTGTAVFHRSFITANTSAISSFNMTLSGVFGSVNNLQNALENNRLKIYVRKVNAANQLDQYGPTSEPLSLHGGLYNFSDFADGLNGLDNSKGFIRTGVSGNTVSGTFGGYNALDGIWIEIQLVDNTISLTNITVAFVQ